MIRSTMETKVISIAEEAAHPAAMVAGGRLAQSVIVASVNRAFVKPKLPAMMASKTTTKPAPGMPLYDAYYAFVASAVNAGDFGGDGGADQIC